MKRVAIVTASRAEYGLLMPLIKKIQEDKDFDLDLIVTGAHLSSRQGHTIDDIIKDGFPIAHEIDILDDDNTPYGISLTMANAIIGFAECFMDDRPNMVIILGDRTEMLGVASAAMNEQIPIVHIHGGEVTEGAVDDCVRHAITKMSYLHFTSTEEYRRRVIQLGEDPKRVFNVGALGAENIRHIDLMTETELRSDLGIPDGMIYAVVTYHPETISILREHKANDIVTSLDCELDILCGVMHECKDIFFIITGSNADAGGDRINDLFMEFSRECDHATYVLNLGVKKYLSIVKYAAFVMGNSSSGIIEAPILGTPTVNIGDRQKGRIMAETVINCECNFTDIKISIGKALKAQHEKTKLFGDGYTSDKILDKIKSFKGWDTLKKGFYDVLS